MIFIPSVNICFVTAFQGNVVHVSAIATNIISTEQLSAEMHELIFLLSTHIPTNSYILYFIFVIVAIYLKNINYSYYS